MSYMIHYNLVCETHFSGFGVCNLAWMNGVPVPNPEILLARNLNLDLKDHNTIAWTIIPLMTPVHLLFDTANAVFLEQWVIKMEVNTLTDHMIFSLHLLIKVYIPLSSRKSCFGYVEVVVYLFPSPALPLWSWQSHCLEKTEDASKLRLRHMHLR